MCRRVPPAVTLAAVAGAAAAGLVVLSLRPDPPPAPAHDSPAARAVPPPDSYPTEPLSPGTPAPEMEAAGWINGPPEPAPKLVLLDIWSGW